MVVTAQRRSENIQTAPITVSAVTAALATMPGARMLSTDVVVPLSKLSDCIAETQRRISEADLYAIIAGHVGDGSFHVGFVLGEEDAGAHERAHRIHDWMVKRAIELGGACTGEHGIGVGKQDYLRLEHGEAVSVMRDIKAAMDPRNILNPGKIFPFEA